LLFPATPYQLCIRLRDDSTSFSCSYTQIAFTFAAATLIDSKVESHLIEAAGFCQKALCAARLLADREDSPVDDKEVAYIHILVRTK
jgi:hypothetical protein